MKITLVVLCVLAAAISYKYYSIRRSAIEENKKRVELQTKDQQNKQEVHESLPTSENDIVFIGDSITELFPVYEYWPGLPVKNRGIGANTSEHVVKRIDRIGKAEKIFLMIGVNDIRNEVDPFENVVAIINKIRPSGAKIYVESVLPAKGFERKIKEHNKKVELWCKQNDVQFIDLFGKFNQVDSFTYDGLHLNSKGYNLLFKELNDCVNGSHN